LARGERAGVDGGAVVVIGLNRFGGQVADTLTQLGHEVLAIDEDPGTVHRWSQRLTYVVQADATDEAALRQIGVPDFQRAVIALGGSIETSVLAVLAVAEIGVPQIWARATSDKHAKILSTVGAHHVVFPEATMGERVAHLVVSKLLDFIEFEDDFAIAKTRAPRDVVGQSLAQSQVRKRHGVTVVGVKSPGQDFVYGRPETVVPANSVLIVAGKTGQVERFAGAT
jgi:trk system potassium uptake protein